MYLGFLIHVSLHFVIILTNMGKRAPDENGDPSNASYRSARSSTISEYLDAQADLE